MNEAYTVSLTEGLKNVGLNTNGALAKTYKDYIKAERAKKKKPTNFLAAMMGAKEPVEEMEVGKALAEKMAKEADVALITIGRNSGEGGDRKPDAGDFYLTGTEKALVKTVSEAFHAQNKKAIVVLNIGGVIETASWGKTPDAVLCAWQGGQEAGNSIADVLTGKVNPSGKLAISFPIKYEDAPTANNFPGKEVKQEGPKDNAADLSGFSFMSRVPWEVVYEEDIYVGYRFYNTFNKPVAYEFGYGLSYTDFTYSNLKINTKTFKNELAVSVDVKNTGSVAGKEVVQVYVGAPSVKLEKPAEELVAFGKTKLLEPGEKTTLKFTVKAEDIASFDETTSSWVIEKGNYSLKVAASSKDIKGKQAFTVKQNQVVGKVSKALEATINSKGAIQKFKTQIK